MKVHTFTTYEFAEVRKAVAGGLAADVSVASTILLNGFQVADIPVLVGAFVVGALAVFGVTNKQVAQVAAVVEAVAPKLTPLVAPVIKAADTPPPAV